MLFRSVTEQWLHSLTSLGQMEANQWQQCGNRTDFPIVTHLSCKKYVRVRVGTHSCVSVYEWWQLISEFLCKLHITCTSSSGHIWVSVCVCVCFCISVHCDNLWPLFFFSSLCFSERTLWSWRRGTETTARTAMVRIVSNTHWCILKMHYVVLANKL